MTPAEIRKERAKKLGLAREVYDRIKAENRDPTAEETTQVDTLIAEADALEAKAVGAEQWSFVDKRLADLGQSTGQISNPLPNEDPSNTRGERHQFSVLKAIREVSKSGGLVGGLTGLEKETHDEMRKQRIEMNMAPPRGIMIPNNLKVNVRAAARFSRSNSWAPQVQSFALDTVAGAGSIPTILDATMIDILRARMVLASMGMKIMDNMQGLFAIPRQTTAASFQWVTQGASVTASNQNIDQVQFAPHTGGAQTAYTRLFLEQTNQNAEALIRTDQVAVIARGLETAAFNGSGSGGAPLGIAQNTLVTTIAGGTNGATPSWANIVDMESVVAIANADMGALGYVTDAGMRGTFKTTLKVAASTFPIYLWDNTPEPLNGYRAGVTNLLPANLTKGSGSSLHMLLYGNWDDAIMALWSGYDTIVDPFTQAGSGGVVVTTLQDADFNIRHPESFSKMVDCVSTQ